MVGGGGDMQWLVGGGGGGGTWSVDTHKRVSNRSRLCVVISGVLVLMWFENVSKEVLRECVKSDGV